MAAAQASSSTQSPAAPASTTPLTASASSWSVVRSRARRAALAAASTTTASWAPGSPFAAAAAASATVRTVPSAGLLTAALASSAACTRARATTWPSHGDAGPQISASPRNSWLTIIPEFPQAPSIAPAAAARQTAAWPAAAGSSSTVWAADRSVRYKLVPVSASGTGYTLSASIADLAWPSASAARRHQRRTTAPSITCAATTPAG
jgi:hypothetical protein